MTHDLGEKYQRLIDCGEIDADPMQAAAVQRFAALTAELAAWRPARGGIFSWMRSQKVSSPRGIYLHGAVGRGKTMLMDLFFESAQVKLKRRLHFHEFMAEAHERIGAAREHIDGDPIPHVAREIAKNAQLLCFDELHVSDIADAMILSRLFQGLFEAGVVVVATSNSQPGELYKDGLNRQLFLPFIALLAERLDVVELEVEKDFRLEKLAGQKLYFSPADDAARQGMDRLWMGLTGGSDVVPVRLEIKGRVIDVPMAAGGVARFNFRDLCAKPLGSLDYLALARAFHTVFIDNIPILTRDKRNEARRFINLIDTFYDQQVGLVVSADAEPDQIYLEGDGVAFFARTASRLIEMRSEAYLEASGLKMTGGPGRDDDAAAAAI